MTTAAPKQIVIAGVARNGVIGNGPKIPWDVPADLQAFKEETLGHTLIMGRKTCESIGRPLPGRRTIVVTRQSDWSMDGVEKAESVKAAVAAAGDVERVYIAGGGQIYRTALAHADELLISWIPLLPLGDVFFPPVDCRLWKVIERTDGDGFIRQRYRRAEVSSARVAS